MYPANNHRVAIRSIDNPFDTSDSSKPILLDYEFDKSVIDYICKVNSDGNDFVISVNGSIVEKDHIVKPDDIICFCMVPTGGGDDGKSILRTVALIVVAAAATYVSGPGAGMFFGGSKAAAFVAGAGVAITGSYLVNSLLPLPTAEMQKLDSADLNSSTNYSWNAPYNMTQEGIALPRLIGTRKFAPPRIGGYRVVPPNDLTSHLIRMQFALCEDVIDELEESDIFINNKAISDYQDYKWGYTNGNVNESVTSDWFKETITEQDIGAELESVGEVYRYSTTFDNFVDGIYQSTDPYIQTPIGTTTIQFKLYFPSGIHIPRLGGYYEDEMGNTYPEGGWAINPDFRFSIQYRRVGLTDWNTVNREIPQTQSLFLTIPKWETVTLKGLSHEYTYEFRFTMLNSTNAMEVREIIGYSSIGSISYQTTNGTNIDSVGISLFFPGGLYYVGDSGNFVNHSIKILTLIRAVGEDDWLRGQSTDVSEATSTPFRRFVLFENLPADQYEILCYISDVPPTSNRYQHTVQFEYIQESVSQQFVYPGVATVSIELPASELASNTWPLVEINAAHADYNSGTRAADNPAWAAYYKLLENGESADNINLTNFTTWATFCDTNSFTCGMYVDVAMSLPSLLAELGRAGSAKVLQIGTKWDVIIDDVSDSVQTFGSDNILEDTFEEVFVSTEDRANIVIVWFFDSNNNNRRTPVRITDNESSNTGIDPAEYTLYAVTNEAQAVKLGMRILNSTRLTVRAMSWTSDIDAINCSVGDVVYLQNNLPIWGVAPGRVVSATTNTVTCSIAKDYDDSDWSGRQLRLLVRHQTAAGGTYVDDIERHPIVNPYNNTDVVTYTLDSATFTRIPAVDSMVLIGWVTGSESSTSDELISVKQVRIVDIEQNQDMTVRITAADYYDDSSVDSYVVSLPSPESGLEVGNIGGNVGWNVTGRVNEDYIYLNWTGNAAVYYIFYRKSVASPGVPYMGAPFSVGDDADTDFSEWRFYGKTSMHSLKIKDLPAPFIYEFSITPYPTPDETKTVEVYFNPTDHGDLVASITNLRNVTSGNDSWDGKDLDITWDEYTMFGFSYFRVEILDDSSNVLRSEQIVKHYYTYPYDLNRLDHGGTASATVKVRVTIVDDRLNEDSTNITTFSNDPPDAVTNLRTVSGSEDEFVGKTIDVMWDESAENDFELYEVQITHGAATVRTAFTVDNRFTYTYEMNQEDGDGTPSNSVVVKVRVLDSFALFGGQAIITLANPVPATPGGLVSTPWMNGLEFNWNPNSEPDIDYYTYRYQIESEGWTNWTNVKTPERVFILLDDTQAETYPSGATVQFQVKAVDTFGSSSSSANVSDVTGSLYIPSTAFNDFGQISAAFYEVPVLRGFTWTSNDPSAGYISWTTGTMYYNGTAYTIGAGNTNTYWVYWDPEGSTGNFAGSVDDSTIPSTAFIMAVNNSGTLDLVWNNALANQVIGSAWIRDAAIINAKIANLAVTNAKINDLDAVKITAGYLSADRIQAGTITAAKIATGTLTANEIAANTITAGEIAANTLTATQISGSGFGNLTISSGTITIQTTDGLTLSGSGNIKVSAGNDINMIGSDSDPGKLNFVGTSYTVEFGGDTDGNRFYISPQTTDVISLYIGNNEYSLLNRFYKVDIDASWSVTLHAYDDGTHDTFFSLLASSAESYVLMRCQSGSLNTGLRFRAASGSAVLSTYLDNKVIDLGESSHAFDDAYADDWNNVADFFYMDERIDENGNRIEVDDIEIIDRIKPSQNVDPRTGLTIINDSSIEPWMVVKHKNDGEEVLEEDRSYYKYWHWTQPGDRIRTWKAGQVEVDPNGKPYLSNKVMTSLLMGAVRKLNSKIINLESGV